MKVFELPPNVVISRTAFQRAGTFGAPWRTVTGLTPEERYFLRDGGVVLFKGYTWSSRGLYGTQWREVYYKKCQAYNRYFVKVPSPETLALIGESMLYGPRDRRKPKREVENA